MVVRVTPEAVMLALESLGLVGNCQRLKVHRVEVDATYGMSLDILADGLHLGPTKRTEGGPYYIDQTVSTVDVVVALERRRFHARIRRHAVARGPWACSDMWAAK